MICNIHQAKIHKVSLRGNHVIQHKRVLTTVLVILDGFGYRQAPENNAIFHARTPNFDRLWETGESTLVSGSGLDVGLPAGQMGNSEVGHMSLGSGRIIYQSITRIDKAIEDGTLLATQPSPMRLMPP